MRHNAIPLFCIAAAALLSGCITRTVEIRPVAPVVELHAAPGSTRGAVAAHASPPSMPQSSGASSMARQQASTEADAAATPPGVQVEAVIPGVYSGRSLSFEKDEAPK